MQRVVGMATALHYSVGVCLSVCPISRQGWVCSFLMAHQHKSRHDLPHKGEDACCIYFSLMGNQFPPRLGCYLNPVCKNFIDHFYSKVVSILKYSAELHVPLHYKDYYTFWWSQELSCLKDNAIKSNKIWKDAGRPRSGPTTNARNSDKRKYRKMLHNERQAEAQHYSGDG